MHRCYCCSRSFFGWAAPGKLIFSIIFGGNGFKKRFATYLVYCGRVFKLWLNPSCMTSGLIMIFARYMSFPGGWWRTGIPRQRDNRLVRIGLQFQGWIQEAWWLQRWEHIHNLQLQALALDMFILVNICGFIVMLCVISLGRKGKTWSGNGKLKSTGCLGLISTWFFGWNFWWPI